MSTSLQHINALSLSSPSFPHRRDKDAGCSNLSAQDPHQIFRSQILFTPQIKWQPHSRQLLQESDAIVGSTTSPQGARTQQQTRGHDRSSSTNTSTSTSVIASTNSLPSHPDNPRPSPCLFNEFSLDTHLVNSSHHPCLRAIETHIYRNYKAREALFLPVLELHDLELQPHVSIDLRHQLFDSIMALHGYFELSYNSLHLTFNIIDRFLSRNRLAKNVLQQLAISAFFIATKYHDVQPPSLALLLDTINSPTTRQQILLLERVLLTDLSYDISVPLPCDFLSYILQNTSLTPRVHRISSCLLDLLAIHIHTVAAPPSLNAATAAFLAAVLHGNEADMNSVLSIVRHEYQHSTLLQHAEIARNVLQMELVDSSNQVLFRNLQERYQSALEI